MIRASDGPALPSSPPARITDAVQLATCGVALLAGVAIVAATPASGERDYLVVFSPWTSQAEAAGAATAAGASLLGLSGFTFVAAVRSDGAGYPGRARERGALLVIPSHGAAGCGLRRTAEARA